MTARLIQNTVVLAKAESTYNTAPSLSGSDAVEVFDFSHSPRKIDFKGDVPLRGYRGGAVEAVGLQSADVGFYVHLQGSGTAGTAPAFSDLLLACGTAITDGASLVEYTPAASGSDGSAYLKHYADGLLYPTGGLRGDFTISAAMGEKAKLTFSFQGLPADESTASNPSGSYGAWKAPSVVTDALASDVTLGCTYSAGALSSGTAYPGQGLEFSAGNAVAVTHLTSGSEVDITDRKPSGKFTLALTAAQELALFDLVTAGTTTSLGFTVGTTGGYIWGIFCPVVQLKNPAVQNVNGRRMVSFDYIALPSSGNDEYTLWFK